MKKALIWFAAVLPVMALAAVGAAVTKDKPVPTMCKLCDMKIAEKDRKFSAVVMEGMERSAFDDIKCAVTWRNGECAMRQAAFDVNAYVYDYGTGEQVSVEKAFYVADAGVATPMESGIVAFKDAEAAEKFIAQQKKGRVLTYHKIYTMTFK